MAMDFTRIRDAIATGIDADVDGKYPAGANRPDTSADEFEAFMHYIAKAIVDEITTNGDVDTSVNPGTIS